MTVGGKPHFSGPIKDCALSDISSIAESTYRREFGRIIAKLIRICGSIDLAEDALQDAFASALTSWHEKGVPDDPAAWIIADRNESEANRSIGNRRLAPNTQRNPV